MTEDQTQINPYLTSRGSWRSLGNKIIVNRRPEVPGHGSGLPSQILCNTPMPSPRRQVRPGGVHQCSPP